MGGEIGVDSAPGEGSSFWATVKLSTSGCDTKATPSRSPCLAGRAGLVVEGSALNRAALRLRLEAWGMTVAEVADGPQALAALDHAVAADRPFAVALIGSDLGDMDGDELMGRIRARWEFAATKLVALRRLSALGNEDADAPAIADASIRKPVLQSLLLDRLTSVLEQRSGPRIEASTAEPAAVTGAPSTGRRLTFLLAEDNQVNQKVISVMLLKAGHAVDVVGDGEGAIDAVRRQAYDVVLMDVQMPKLDGVAATRQIRRLPGPESRVPIIALTANAMAGDREAFLSAGMNDYVSKPIAADDLAAAIERQCGVATELDSPLAAVGSDGSDSMKRNDDLTELLDTLDGAAGG
jgi:CheY-like chemotaxis protein